MKLEKYTATRDAIKTLRVATKINVHKQTKTIKSFIGKRNAKIPTVVATPFPPLKLRNIECALPVRSAMALKISRLWLASKSFAKKYRVKNAFKKSIKKIRAKYFLPKTLPIFVAPIFPDPCLVISTLKKYFENQYPVGIAPTR